MLRFLHALAILLVPLQLLGTTPITPLSLLTICFYPILPWFEWRWVLYNLGFSARHFCPVLPSFQWHSAKCSSLVCYVPLWGVALLPGLSVSTYFLKGSFPVIMSLGKCLGLHVHLYFLVHHLQSFLGLLALATANISSAICITICYSSPL